MKDHPTRWIVAGLGIAIGTAMLVRFLLRVRAGAGPVADYAGGDTVDADAETSPAAPLRPVA